MLNSFLSPAHRTDVFEILLWVVVKVHDPAGRGIEAIIRLRIVERRHRPLDFFFYEAVFLFIIKWPVFKDDVFACGHVPAKHLCGEFAGIIRLEPRAPALCTGDSPIA